jgi:hypothetical protein
MICSGDFQPDHSGDFHTDLDTKTINPVDLEQDWLGVAVIPARLANRINVSFPDYDGEDYG